MYSAFHESNYFNTGRTGVIQLFILQKMYAKNLQDE